MWQVLGEFLAGLRRWEQQRGDDPRRTRRSFELMTSRMRVEYPNLTAAERSFEFRDRDSLSHWDSLLHAPKTGVDAIHPLPRVQPVAVEFIMPRQPVRSSRCMTGADGRRRRPARSEALCRHALSQTARLVSPNARTPGTCGRRRIALICAVHNLRHFLPSSSLDVASAAAKNRVSPQFLHTTTVNLALRQNVPSPGRWSGAYPPPALTSVAYNSLLPQFRQSFGSNLVWCMINPLTYLRVNGEPASTYSPPKHAS